MFGQLNAQEIVMMIPGVLMGLTFHEFAHAWVATRFGDDTPRLQGRVTLSPLAHLDVLGTLLILIGGFGWAKPVMVNTSRLRPRVWGDIAVSLAGVTMNLILAILFMILTVLASEGMLFGQPNDVLTNTLFYVVHINVVLVAFNLLPIPPLDGFHVARYLFPRSMYGVVETLYRYGPYILLLLVVTGATRWFMTPLYDLVFSGLLWILSPVFNLMGIA